MFDFARLHWEQENSFTEISCKSVTQGFSFVKPKNLVDQGNRELGNERLYDCRQVVVVPASAKALVLDAEFGRFVLLEQVEGHVT